MGWLRILFIISLLSSLLFSCEKEKVYLYGNNKPNSNYTRYPNPYLSNPYSRSHRDPYEFDQGNRPRPVYYDQDYYYIPPPKYRNIEPENNNRVFNGFDVKS